ncbi:MAG: methyltransferase domain-containing protein [Thermodesulfovibrio sp.]|nr:methyltransferase domain-containing protein [Thermodesulfovibrio sp.]
MKKLKFYFDKAASTYEVASTIQKKVAIDLLNMIEEKHYPNVIEIGSGGGFLTKLLTKRITFEKFFHIDISFELLKRLKSNFDKRHFLINAQAEKMPFRKEVADLIVSSSTLHWLENQEESFSPLFETLKKDGKFYFSLFTSKTLKEFKEVCLNSGFGSYYPLKEVSFYLGILKKLELNFYYEVKIYTEKYADPKELLLSLKLTGTNYTLNKKFSGKSSFLNFCKLYKEKFGNFKGIYATYEVLFIKGQK